MADQIIKKTYIGYDLGDGESITDIVTLEVGASTTKTDFSKMTMPGITNAGQAVPTVFAFDQNGKVVFSKTILAMPEALNNIVVNFKRCPSDIIKVDVKKSVSSIIDMLNKADGWPSASEWPEGSTKEIDDYRNAVTTFTNAIFNDEDYMNRVKAEAHDSSEIVFCIGHPTEWTDFDIAVYRLIFKTTVMGNGKYAGKKASILLEKESRAAYLYAKDKEAIGTLQKGTSVLIVDVGSSTVDLTAMTASANNVQHNGGSNYLGARSIDYMIKDWYLKKLKENPAFWQLYNNLVSKNPNVDNAVTLACRLAKEEVFSNGISQIHYGAMPGQLITRDDLDKIVDSSPVAKYLKSEIGLSDQVCRAMGDKNWKDLFRELIIGQKSEMHKKGITVSRIILTGSASRMPYVRSIIQQVFFELTEDSISPDMDPSTTISKGLALVGPSNEKSAKFQQDLNLLIDEKLGVIIDSNIPALAKKMSVVISDIIIPKIRSRINQWKEGKIKTLNDMNKMIKNDCSETNMQRMLSGNKQYNDAIAGWLSNSVGKDIAVELKSLCDKYGVTGVTVDDLNIMTAPKVSITGDIVVDPLDFMDAVGTIVSLIAGIISSISVATIMAVVTIVLTYISTSLAAALFTALVNMGPVGWGILAAVLGISVTVLVKKGFNGFKKAFSEKVMGWNLPETARKLMTEKKVDKSLAKAEIPKQIESAFLKPDVKSDVIGAVSDSLKEQIKVRADDIKYAIESR